MLKTKIKASHVVCDESYVVEFYADDEYNLF